MEWWRIDGTMLDGSHGPWNTIHLLFFLLWTLGGFSYGRKTCKWCKISSLINHFIENGHSQKKKAKVGRNRAKFAKVWWPWERLREFFVINADMISFNKWSKVSAMAGIFKIPLFIISKPLNSMIFSTTVLINFCN